MSKNQIGRVFFEWSISKLLRFKTFLLISRLDIIIKNMRPIYEASLKLLNKRYTNLIIEKMYGDIFVGGKNEKELTERIKTLNKDGIVAISDFAMELIGDDEEHLIPSVVQYFKNCILSTMVTSNQNMIAVKMSSLTTNSHIKKMNHIQFVLKIIEDEIDSRPNLTVNEEFLEAINLNLIKFSEKGLTRILNVENLKELISLFKKDGFFRINVFTFITENKSAPQKIISMFNLIYDIPEREIRVLISKVCQMESYLSDLFLFSSQQKCSLMIDAEQTYLQVYIDYVTSHYFKIHNKEGRCILLNTIQMYLVDSSKNLKHWIDFCKNENLSIGIKIVRGAYISEEKILSKMRDTPDPINKGQIITNSNYNKGVETIIENYIPTSRIIIATHNLDSISLLGDKLNQIRLTKSIDYSGIMVAQLLGIGENASWLAKNYSLKRAKYIPYGNFDILIPYLFRRAEESSLISKIKLQNNLINFEIKERALSLYSKQQIKKIDKYKL